MTVDDEVVPSVSGCLAPKDCPWDGVYVTDHLTAGFRIIATEIVRRIDDEKWYETRESIEKALLAAYARGVRDGK